MKLLLAICIAHLVRADCLWRDHCQGSSCKTFDDCTGALGCMAGKCTVDALAPSNLGAECAIDIDCSVNLKCISSKCNPASFAGNMKLASPSNGTGSMNAVNLSLSSTEMLVDSTTRTPVTSSISSSTIPPSSPSPTASATTVVAVNAGLLSVESNTDNLVVIVPLTSPTSQLISATLSIDVIDKTLDNTVILPTMSVSSKQDQQTATQSSDLSALSGLPPSSSTASEADSIDSHITKSPHSNSSTAKDIDLKIMIPVSAGILFGVGIIVALACFMYSRLCRSRRKEEETRDDLELGTDFLQARKTIKFHPTVESAIDREQDLKVSMDISCESSSSSIAPTWFNSIYSLGSPLSDGPVSSLDAQSTEKAAQIYLPKHRLLIPASLPLQIYDSPASQPINTLSKLKSFDFVNSAIYIYSPTE